MCFSNYCSTYTGGESVLSDAFELFDADTGKKVIFNETKRSDIDAVILKVASRVHFFFHFRFSLFFSFCVYLVCVCSPFRLTCPCNVGLSISAPQKITPNADGDVDIGCGGAFGGKNEEDEEAAGGVPDENGVHPL